MTDMPGRLDEIDRKILRLLQADCRLTMQEIAERVGLSASPCHRRIKIMEDAGLIKGYVALVDQRKIGLPVSVFVSIKLERQREKDLEAFSKAISRWPEVLECYLMTGHRDYLLRVVVEDLQAYEKFLKQKLTLVPGIASIEFELRARPDQVFDRRAGVTS